jgi:hypothetical protein
MDPACNFASLSLEVGMSRSWDHRKGEPALWYARFVEFYLTAGEERTLNGAYRAFMVRRQAGTKPARDFSRVRAPGEWKKQCAKWSWVARSHAYDAHQARMIQRAHFNAIKKANEKHLVLVQNHFAKLIRQLAAIDYSTVVNPGKLLDLTERLIMLERLLLGTPLQAEEVRVAPVDPTTIKAVQESTVERIDTPEMMAEVLKILDAQGAFDDDRSTPAAAG